MGTAGDVDNRRGLLRTEDNAPSEAATAAAPPTGAEEADADEEEEDGEEGAEEGLEGVLVVA